MSWTCSGITNDGNTDRKHNKRLVSETFCPDCGLTREEVEAKQSNSGKASWMAVVGLVSFLAILGSGGYFAWQQFQRESPDAPNQPTDGQDIVLDDTSIKNVRYGISVDLPENWELRKPSRDYPPDVFAATKDLFQLLAPNRDGSYRENILIKIEQVAGNSTFLDDYANQQRARIEQIGTFTVENDQNIELNGQLVRELVYSGNDGEYDLKRRRIIAEPVLSSDYFFLITYNADKDDYETYMPDVEQVINSILLLE